MSNSRLRCLIISIGIGLILLFITGTLIYIIRRHKRPVINYDSCPRPTEYATDYDFDYTKKSKEYRNTNTPIDYFRLSLSWSPTFCDGQKKYSQKLFQCQHSFGFIVHGLWPSKIKMNNGSHPRNCRNEKPMSMDVIRKYFCLMPSEVLMQAEWEKHGTCYWQTPEEYFEQINYLYTKINIPNNITDILNNGTISKRMRHDNIKQSFLNSNPQLLSDAIDVMLANGGKKLREVAFCYDHSFNYTKCN